MSELSTPDEAKHKESWKIWYHLGPKRGPGDSRFPGNYGTRCYKESSMQRTLERLRSDPRVTHIIVVKTETILDEQRGSE